LKNNKLSKSYQFVAEN